MLRNVIAILVLLALSIGLAPAGEIRVLAAVAVQDPLDRLAQAFTRSTGHQVNIGYSLTGPILNDIKAGKPLKTPVTMAAIKADKRLADMALVKYSRLSVQPVTPEEWKIVCKMGGL